jgi:general stress protein 26
MRLQWGLFALVMALVGASVVPTHGAPLTPELQKALDSSKYVYVQSARKDGALGKAAEIWFMHHNGAVWVSSPVATHRVKRIQTGRTKAKVWIGKTDGPAFNAKGAIVKDPEVNEVLFKTFAKKYSDGWSSHEKSFRDGLANGSRMLIKYEPAE